MKRLFILFLLLFPLVIFSQMPEGYFTYQDEYANGEQLFFGKEQRFSYIDNCSDCGRKGGSGTYSVQHDTLVLQFQSSCKVEALTEIDTVAADDSVTYSIAINPIDNIEWTTVQLCTNTGTNLRNFAVKDHHCAVKVSTAEAQTCYIHILSLAVGEDWLPLSTLPKNARLTLVNETMARIPPWTIYRMKIVFIGKNKLILVPLEGMITYNGNHVERKYYRGTLR